MSIFRYHKMHDAITKISSRTQSGRTRASCGSISGTFELRPVCGTRCVLTSVVTFTNAPSGSGAGREAPHCRCAGDQRFDFTSVVTTATMASRSILRGPVNSSNPSQSRAPLSSSLLPLQPTPGIGRRASWSPGGTHEYLRKPARSCQYGDQTRDIRKCSSMVSKSRFRLP